MSRNWKTTWIVAAFCLMCGTGRAQTTQADLKSRFLDEAPKEWTKLEAAALRWEGSFKVSVRSAVADGKPASDWDGLTRYWCNGDTGGVKIAMTSLPHDGRSSVQVSNPRYDFHLTRAKADQKLFLIGYSLVKEDGTRDEDMAFSLTLELTNWLLIAESFTNTPLRKMISGEFGEIRSVTAEEVNQRELVRVEFQQIRWGKKRVPFPATVWVDPKQHWAIVAYDRKNEDGGFRGSVEYQEKIKDVAFPSRITEEVYDKTGKVERKEVREFDPPVACTLQAKDFELEAFGLEPPKNQESGPRKPIR